jgi:hypothetical protein
MPISFIVIWDSCLIYDANLLFLQKRKRAVQEGIFRVCILSFSFTSPPTCNSVHVFEVSLLWISL